MLDWLKKTFLSRRSFVGKTISSAVLSAVGVGVSVDEFNELADERPDIAATLDEYRRAHDRVVKAINHREAVASVLRSRVKTARQLRDGGGAVVVNREDFDENAGSFRQVFSSEQEVESWDSRLGDSQNWKRVDDAELDS